MLWPVFLAVLLVFLVVSYQKGRKLRALKKQFKSDFLKVPLLGDVQLFFGNTEDRMTHIQTYSRQAIKYDGWTSVDLGDKFYAVVAHAEDAEFIMKNHLEKDDVLKITRALIGDGLIYAPVHIWRPRRKILAPTFSQHNLNHFVDIFYNQSSIMLDNLKKEADKGTFPIWKYFTSYTMDSVCHTTLGVDIGVQKTVDHKFLRYFQRFADLVAKRIFRPWLHNETSFKYLSYFGSYPEMVKVVSYIRGFVMDTIEQKRVELKELAKNGDTSKKPDAKGTFRPILELLIEASGGDKGYNNKELEEETQVILFAGTDTSAVGSCFISMMLALHPDVQDKVYNEVRDVLGDTSRPIRAEDLTKFTYLEAVVKETLRLYPPVPLTARKVLKDDVTPSGIKLTPGIGLVIVAWAVHRNPRYWGNDADDFRPERFFDSPPTHPAAYMPFSAGPRNCLGYKYAMMSMMTAVANLVTRYRILPSDDKNQEKPMRLCYEVMMKDSSQFRLRLQTR